MPSPNGGIQCDGFLQDAILELDGVGHTFADLDPICTFQQIIDLPDLGRGGEVEATVQKADKEGGGGLAAQS